MKITSENEQQKIVNAVEISKCQQNVKTKLRNLCKILLNVKTNKKSTQIERKNLIKNERSKNAIKKFQLQTTTID